MSSVIFLPEEAACPSRLTGAMWKLQSLLCPPLSQNKESLSRVNGSLEESQGFGHGQESCHLHQELHISISCTQEFHISICSALPLGVSLILFWRGLERDV